MQQYARTRSRVLSTKTSVEDRVRKNYFPYQCNGAALPLGSTNLHSDLYTTFYSDEVTNDIVTSDYASLIAKGVIINNAYSNHKTTVSTPGIGIAAEFTTERYACSPARWTPDYIMQDTGYRMLSRIDWNGGVFLEPPDMTAALNQAISAAVTEAWANIDSSEISALVSVLEGEKTLMGLLDCSRRLYKFARNVKRLQLKKLSSVFKDLSSKESKHAWRQIKDEFSLNALADRYLEVRYGLRPIYYDMMGALKAFFKEARLERHTYRGRQVLTSHTSDTKVTVGRVTDYYLPVFTLARRCDVETEIRAGVLCEVDYDSLDPWGLQSAAESMWDLMPYSFIVDWFFNVGDTLAAWTPNAGLSPRASWYKVKTTCTRTSNLVDTRFDPVALAKMPYPYRVKSQSYVGWFDGPCFKVTEDTYRVPHTDRYTLPTMKLRLNTAKLLDLAAISRNLFYGGSYPLITRPKKV